MVSFRGPIFYLIFAEFMPNGTNAADGFQPPLIRAVALSENMRKSKRNQKTNSGQKNKDLICRENIALLISVLALILSWLGYRSTVANPDFSVEARASEEVRVEEKNHFAVLNAHWIHIDLHNKGRAAAKNVRLSMWPVHEFSKKPWVSLNPNKQFTTRVEGGVLYVIIPVLGKGERVDVDVKTQPEHTDDVSGRINEKRPLSYSQLTVNVDCDEGAYSERSIPVSSRETIVLENVQRREKANN